MGNKKRASNVCPTCGRKKSGAKPVIDLKKAKILRAEGWSWKAIGTHFGVTGQAVEIRLRRDSK